MANAKQCDVCKGFYAVPQKATQITVFKDNVALDVCNKCYESLDKFIKGRFYISQKPKRPMSDDERKNLSEKMRKIALSRKYKKDEHIESELSKDGVWDSDTPIEEEEIMEM